MMVFIGLGNIGKEYENTYHNVGFMAVDAFAQKHGLVFSKNKYNAEFTEGVVDGKKVVLLKPTTYMNNSGISVNEIVKKLKLDLTQICVVYDDIDLPIGNMRFKYNGGPGTHNGMRSIISHLQSNEFSRLRIGIGAHYYNLSDYVLSRISKDHLQKLEPVFEDVLKKMHEILMVD